MRMSCNGCRVLRKGCSEKCSIRPCLEWIKTREGQGNATEFLAKFYGRAGLMNLINAGPEHLRPAIFKSLLHEACGRIVNPIYGSVGLLGSGSWELCQAAVDAVLNGEPITPITSDSAADVCGPPLKSYDIRHVIDSDDRKRSKSRRSKNRAASAAAVKQDEEKSARSSRRKRNPVASRTESSRNAESSLSHQSEVAAEDESTVSMETVEKSPVTSPAPAQTEVVLELTLGLEPVVPMKKRRIENFDSCNLRL